MTNGPNEKAARLIDVAKRANVSRATAARALGGYGLVTDNTRKRIFTAAEELNYRVNELARSMRSGRTLTIGVVVADIANSFFNSAIRAIIETSSKAGYQILVLNTDDDLERERTAVRVLIEKRVDGLIVVPSSPDDIDHLLITSEPEVPIVVLDREVTSSDIDSVTTDDFEAARSAVRHFAIAGHTRLGLLVSVGGVAGYSATMPEGAVATVRTRVGGAAAGCADLKVDLRPEWIRYCHCDVDIAREAALEILNSRPRPTALLATNEEMALATVAAAAELGFGIGVELSIIGFDDAPWARVFNPPLSVVRRPVAKLGASAVEVLLKKIDDGKFRRSHRFPAELIIRRSVGSPAA